jgi:hypothetical protein
VDELFAPFSETVLGTIRAELFFASSRSPTRSRQAFFRLYPPYLLVRSYFERRPRRDVPVGDPFFLFVSDYAAESGFGTIQPLLNLAPRSVLVANRAVVRQRRGELPEGVAVIDADADLPARYWGDFYCRAESDFGLVMDVTPTRLRPAITAGRHLIKALLSRAYAYERMFMGLFEANQHIKGVVTHNDFSALSHLAGLCARRFRVPDFTLQHGFPTQEHFPVTASRYCIWGSRFEKTMVENGTSPERLVITGAPRLDRLWDYRSNKAAGSGSKPQKILYLSQGHSQLLSERQHKSVLSLLGTFRHDPEREVVVRLHPQESKRSVRAMRKVLPGIRHSEGMSLASDLSRAGVVLCAGSTAMLEAMILSVPVIEIRPSPHTDCWRPFEAILQVSTANDLIHAVNRLDDAAFRSGILEQQDALLGEYIFAPGNGAEKTWNYIETSVG